MQKQRMPRARRPLKITVLFLSGLFVGGLITTIFFIWFILTFSVMIEYEEPILPKEQYICLDNCKNGAKQLVPIRQFEEI
jgi:hypothetical protein